MTQPLQGIRILDLSRLLPGGYCTQLLADMGAEVVKVETPRLGDYARIAPDQFGGDELFKAINRGKKSLALNFRNARGREVFLKLAETADVVFETFRPGLVSRWGIDHEAVRAVNPGVVYCSLSGYGQDGPYRDRAGHDLNYVALTGLLDFNGSPGGPPMPLSVQIADMAGAMLAAVAILGALVGRASSGKGRYLDAGMMDVAVSWAGPVLGALHFAPQAEPARGRGPLSGGLPCYNVYQAADGAYLTIGALEGPLWATFCKTIEREELIGRQWDEEAIPLVAEVFAGRTREQWLSTFEGLEVCLEPVHTVAEMLDHPQVRARGLVLEDSKGRPLGVHSPFGRGSRNPGPPPLLGQHTREVLQAHGFSDEDIRELAEAQVIRV